MNRNVFKQRTTRETDISVKLDLDGSGKSDIDTGVAFFDHMLEGFARHGFFDLELKCKGDIEVDCHHTVEDCGIVLGSAIAEAVGDKKGIKRFGHFILPMDDALVLSAVDLSGRPYLDFKVDFKNEKCGAMDSDLFNEFFYALSYSSMMNIHIQKLAGENDHHIAEAAFKSFAKSLDMAVSFDERITDVLSTKGSL
ncbi:imidazoleglycerol-phosphate dehydratase HisB [Lachnospiraceae bacterium C1.1]|nr:imidazoleglycerol-phosphate dehydratase HisB [Lachnospiraceae bacterium C1.1]